jgi:hypothetical protein
MNAKIVEEQRRHGNRTYLSIEVEAPWLARGRVILRAPGFNYPDDEDAEQKAAFEETLRGIVRRLTE